MIYCCTVRPTRYKQRRQPCRTINCHKPSCHHKRHKSLVKTTLLMGHRGFYGSCASADMRYRGLFQSRRCPSLAFTTTCSSSRLFPCWGSGIPFSWALPMIPKAPKPFGQPGYTVLDSLISAAPFWRGTTLIGTYLKMFVFTPGIR